MFMVNLYIEGQIIKIYNNLRIFEDNQFIWVELKLISISFKSETIRFGLN